MLKEALEGIEKMTDAEKASLLATTFPEELEKQAAADIASHELAEALYAYGALKAEGAVAEEEGVEKIAAEAIAEHNEALENVDAVIEERLNILGVAATEDPIEFHKEAQAAAGLIFAGYSETLEKLAAKGKAGAIKSMLGKAHKAAKDAGKAVVKHKGKAALGAGGIAAGVYGAKKLMDKKASEASIGDIIDAIDVRDAYFSSLQDVEAGVEKLAAAGAGMGEKLMKSLKGGAAATGAHLKKHKGLYGAGAGGAAAGFGAGRLSKKD